MWKDELSAENAETFLLYCSPEFQYYLERKSKTAPPSENMSHKMDHNHNIPVEITEELSKETIEMQEVAVLEQHKEQQEPLRDKSCKSH